VCSFCKFYFLPLLLDEYCRNAEFESSSVVDLIAIVELIVFVLIRQTIAELTVGNTLTAVCKSQSRRSFPSVSVLSTVIIEGVGEEVVVCSF
jgi:hypothetical protein